MPSHVEELRERLKALNDHRRSVMRSIAYFEKRERPVTVEPKMFGDPSPQCQTEYNTAEAADGTYAAAVAATNAAMANEQTADLFRQAAWEEYWNCESP